MHRFTALVLIILAACGVPSAAQNLPTATPGYSTPVYIGNQLATRTAINSGGGLPVIDTPTVTVDTPRRYADFAIHPSGGTLAAVSEQQLDLFTIVPDGLELVNSLKPTIDVIFLDEVAYSPDGKTLLVSGMKPTDGSEQIIYPEPVMFAARDSELQLVYESNTSYNVGSTISLAHGANTAAFVYNLNNASCNRTGNTLVMFDASTLQTLSPTHENQRVTGAYMYGTTTAIVTTTNYCIRARNRRNLAGRRPDD